MDRAKFFLCKLASVDDGPIGAYLVLVKSMEAASSKRAAVAVMDRLINAKPGTAQADLYAGMRASLDLAEASRIPPCRRWSQLPRHWIKPSA